MQALESLRAAVSGARAAVSGAVSGAAGSALHALPIIGHLTAADESRHSVPHLPETGYVGGNAICAAADKRVDDYLGRRSTKAYMRALVKDGSVASEDDLIHQHGGEGPFMHPKLALHMAQWANPAFASVVNGWVLRYIAADRALADDIVRRAAAGGAGDALGSSLTHTMQEVPMLPDSQPQQGEAAAEVEASAAAEAPAAKAPPRRKAAPPEAEAEPALEPLEEAMAMEMAEEASEEESEEEAPPPVKTPATRQPRRLRAGAKTTPRAKAKAPKAKATVGGRRRRARREETYKLYLHKVLKQIHPELGISAKAMEVMNNMVADLFDSLATEASTLVLKDKARTLSAREVAAAVKLRFPGDLRAHAMSEGAKAVARFNSRA